MSAVVPRDLNESSLLDLARRQNAVATRAQLSRAGVAEFRVRRQVAARRWQEVGPLVIALHNGPLTVEQQQWGSASERWTRGSTVRPDRFGVEVDGAIRLIVGTYWADCDRSNELVIAGESLVRFPSIACYLAPEVVADQLQRMMCR